jgi:hypothetical protein
MISQMMKPGAKPHTKIHHHAEIRPLKGKGDTETILQYKGIVHQEFIQERNMYKEILHHH